MELKSAVADQAQIGHHICSETGRDDFSFRCIAFIVGPPAMTDHLAVVVVAIVQKCERPNSNSLPIPLFHSFRSNRSGKDLIKICDS